jgi:hypothetical protein
MPANPPIIMPFMKLPPLNSPRFVEVPVVDADDLLVVELLLTPLWDLEGVLLNDFLPELKRGFASALSTGIVTATVKANRLSNSSAFFHMVMIFLLKGL